MQPRRFSGGNVQCFQIFALQYLHDGNQPRNRRLGDVGWRGLQHQWLVRVALSSCYLGVKGRTIEQTCNKSRPCLTQCLILPCLVIRMESDNGPACPSTSCRSFMTVSSPFMTSMGVRNLANYWTVKLSYEVLLLLVIRD